ncbi:MAG: hypothetical protein IPK75_18775, partial [Acidobacteria bacterium]|nr:hypothetical protein [Acidobacteriota bacterium]
MARPKKAPSKPEEQIDGIAVSLLSRLLAAIRERRQIQVDTNMEHAAAWKELHDAGANAAAWKALLRIERMELTKRTEFLRAFDAGRAHLKLDAQEVFDFDGEKKKLADAAALAGNAYVRDPDDEPGFDGDDAIEGNGDEDEDDDEPAPAPAAKADAPLDFEELARNA